MAVDPILLDLIAEVLTGIATGLIGTALAIPFFVPAPAALNLVALTSGLTLAIFFITIAYKIKKNVSKIKQKK